MPSLRETAGYRKRQEKEKKSQLSSRDPIVGHKPSIYMSAHDQRLTKKGAFLEFHAGHIPIRPLFNSGIATADQTQA
jgi:hypothetical protein